MFTAVFFHDYGFTNDCPTDKCRQEHGSILVDRRSGILCKVVSCLPLLGQIVGVLAIAAGINEIRNGNGVEKITGASTIVRGFLTVLGLGVLCLLIDIILTVVTVVRNKNKHASAELN